MKQWLPIRISAPKQKKSSKNSNSNARDAMRQLGFYIHCKHSFTTEYGETRGGGLMPLNFTYLTNDKKERLSVAAHRQKRCEEKKPGVKEFCEWADLFV